MHRNPTDSPSGLTRRAAMGRASALAAALAFGRRIGSAAAQEATPPPDPDGVSGEVLAASLPTAAPGVELALRRTTIAPGGGLGPHGHPGQILFVVDAGTWGFTPLEGTFQLMRAAGDGSPAPAEEPPLGVELILTKGDALFAEASRDEMRNAGEDDVVLLLAALTPAGQDIQTD
jgi:hypothetical protein